MGFRLGIGISYVDTNRRIRYNIPREQWLGKDAP